MTGSDMVVRLRAKARRHLLDALDCRGLARGSRIEFIQPGRCIVREFEEAMPGPGEVLIETLVSAISRGTECAFYQGLENTPIEYPYVPGSSSVGRVIAVGSMTKLQAGEVVFGPGPHASIYLSPEQRVVPLRPGIRTDAAAMALMGFVALHGLRCGSIRPDERVAVFGCGLIGQLTAQLGQLAGARVVAIATSPERLKVAASCGVAAVVDAIRERPALDRLEASVVIETTGNPSAVHDAIRASGSGARVVLVGSSRGVSRDVDFSALQEKRISLIGAHVGDVPHTSSAAVAWSWRRGYETYLALLAQGRLVIDPLITRQVAPNNAPVIYADLTRSDDKSVVVLFDWAQQGPWKPKTEIISPLRIFVQGARKSLGRLAPPPRFVERRFDRRVLRFGLIGCGEIATESALALRSAANTAITFTMDPRLDMAQSLAAASHAKYSDKVDDLLQSDQVDVVLISTPHHLHASLAIRAAEAGKHIVVEKPMATSVADCSRMISAASHAGVTISVCYCQRYDPRVQRARMLLAKGVLGEILGTRIAFGQYRDRSYWQAGLTGRVSSDWRARRETAGGGVLIMNACHILDYMTWLVSSPVTEVMALTGNFSGFAEVEDTVSMSYRYANAAIGTLDATTRLLGPSIYEQSIWGTDGQIILAPVLRFWSRHTVDGYESGRWHTVRDLPRPAERRQFFEQFATAVLDKGAIPVTALEAISVQATIEAAYESAATGRTGRVGATATVSESSLD